MKSRRLIASVVVGAALVLGTSGCALVSTQATTIPYSPADGVNVPDSSGPLQVRNALIVANDEGTEGNFIAAIVNNTDDAETLNIAFGEGVADATVRVPARTVVSLGIDGEEPILVEGLDSKPGSDLPTSFQSGDGETVLVDVPVLDGTLDYLTEYVP